MAKATTIKIKLNSTAGTGYYYVAKKNSRTMTEKMVVKKYDPVIRKHVEFKEGKRLYGTNLRVYSPKIIKDEEKPIIILKAGVYTDEIKKDIYENINSEAIFI